MKHVKIIFTLTLIVLVASMMIYFVEGFTTPYIDAYNERQANLAKLDILPDYDGSFEDVSEDYDLENSPIVKMELAGEVAVFYTIEFGGYNPGITVLVGFDLVSNNIIGFRVIEQNETAGLGSVITEEDFQTQFDNLSPDDIDSIGGTTAVVTLGGVKTALNSVADFHSVEFQGAVLETPEERIIRLKEEITEVDATFTDITSDYDISGSPISKVEMVNNGSDFAILYTVEFAGYRIQFEDETRFNEYFVSFDLDTHDLIGLRVDKQFDTAGFGDQILDPVFEAQFDNLAQDAIDDVAGVTASVTLGGLKGSLEDVVNFHKSEIEGTHVETYPEMVERYKDEITVVDAIINDDSANYDLTETMVTKVELANDGTSDVAVIYTVEFVGYNTTDVVEYIISFDLDTHDILGFRVLYQNETIGYGSLIEDDDFYIQFEDMPQLDAQNGDIDAIAGTSGAPDTTFAFKASLYDVVSFHQTEFQGMIVETDEERQSRLWSELFPTATVFTKVTRDYSAHYDVEEFYEAYDGATYLGNIYHVKAEGASYSEETYLEFFLGIAEDNTFTGVKMWDDSETDGKADPFYLVEYSDLYLGEDIETDYTIDEVAGATMTNTALQYAVLQISIYHVEEYLGLPFARPANVDTADANLLLAFPTAVTFNSVYLDYAYEANIYNLYEALDGSGTVIGYVYYGYANGLNLIEFTWGVDLSGTTQEIYIVLESETWELAETQTYTTPQYDGTAGYFPTTTWLDNFEGVTFSSLLNTEIDDIIGVSRTTESLRDVLEIIAQFHSDESVGGAG